MSPSYRSKLPSTRKRHHRSIRWSHLADLLFLISQSRWEASLHTWLSTPVEKSRGGGSIHRWSRRRESAPAPRHRWTWWTRVFAFLRRACKHVKISIFIQMIFCLIASPLWCSGIAKPPNLWFVYNQNRAVQGQRTMRCTYHRVLLCTNTRMAISKTSKINDRAVPATVAFNQDICWLPEIMMQPAPFLKVWAMG